jgi:hypothetical protein
MERKAEMSIEREMLGLRMVSSLSLHKHREDLYQVLFVS